VIHRRLVAVAPPRRRPIGEVSEGGPGDTSVSARVVRDSGVRFPATSHARPHTGDPETVWPGTESGMELKGPALDVALPHGIAGPAGRRTVCTVEGDQVIAGIEAHR
jgi:hypothetical protein